MSQFIIVANGKTEELMAKRIHALISQDERFEALCWTEKQYKASAQTISSSQNCLFIGETSEYKANSFGDGIKWKYDQCGMKYGWIGRKGFLFVDKKEKLSAEQKQELAQKFSKFFDDAKKGAKQIEEKTQTEGSGEKANPLKKLFNKKNKAPIIAAGTALLFTPIGFGVLPTLLIGGILGGGAFNVTKFLTESTDSPKFNEYRYAYLVNEFCVNALSQFLGGSEISDEIE